MTTPVGLRTHRCGELTEVDVDGQVTLCGWVAKRRDHGGVAFLDLRDASGVVQVVIHDEAVASPLRSEFCLRIVGTVTRRPEGNDNPNLATGTIEVEATTVEVLSESAVLPFPIEEHETTPVSDEVRYKYRYLDLRRAASAAAIRLRSDVNQAARSVLLADGFVEVETPTLTRSTPEGARDFVVPARLQPGSWYALPQSPQLFKQLLMVSGLERYFQIARCYRDEDFRADRQPEFTQLDVEMSFVVEDDVIAMGERIVSALWALIGHEVALPIPRITYAEAMRRYGSDKPDLRFGVELVDCTGYFAGTEFGVFQAPHVGAVVMPGGASQTRKVLDGWQDWAKARGARGLAYVLVGDDGELKGPVAKNISDAERAGLAAHCGAQPGDCIFFGAGTERVAKALLGAARLEIGRRCELIDERAWAFTWVVDAPMFEPAGETDDVAVGSGAWTAVHHAFTSPKPESLDTFDTDPGSALAYAYDIVCNGNEIGGGSIRIHRPDVQSRVFEVMGLGPEEAEEKFGFLLEAFKYGAPPHGGIAFGWDRVYALLTGASSIREVIAFPKTGGGFDPLTSAPAPITAAQRKEAGVDWVAPPPRPAATDDARRPRRPERRRPSDARSAGRVGVPYGPAHVDDRGPDMTDLSTDRSAEAKATYHRYVAGREAVARGERTWSSLGAEFFTEDAVFIDPAWGRVEGRAAIAEFMDESMAGLDDWSFPEEWTMVDGDRVVTMWWNRLPGTQGDGTPYQATGISILHYAGDGQFSYEHDILNMAHIGELIGDSGWQPPTTMNFPPARPNRDPLPPRGWLDT